MVIGIKSPDLLRDEFLGGAMLLDLTEKRKEKSDALGRS